MTPSSGCCCPRSVTMRILWAVVNLPITTNIVAYSRKFGFDTTAHTQCKTSEIHAHKNGGKPCDKFLQIWNSLTFVWLQFNWCSNYIFSTNFSQDDRRLKCEMSLTRFQWKNVKICFRCQPVCLFVCLSVCFFTLSCKFARYVIISIPSSYESSKHW